MKMTARSVVLALVLIGLVLPIFAGTWQTLRAAFGILPALGAVDLSLDPWQRLFALPGLMTSVWLSLWTGLVSTVLALGLAVGFCAAMQNWLGGISRWLAPFLAVPHAALAIGLGFVIAPSGLLVRLVQPMMAGNVPPNLPFPHDPWGVALILGLVIKEVPFFLLVILAAMGQLPIRTHLATGRALGYGKGVVWAKIIFPMIWPLIRLPVYVVLSFALSVVDVAILLGPSNPPTLAVAITRWFSSPDSSMILPASAGAVLQLALVGLSIAGLILAEQLLARIGRWWVRRGGRGSAKAPALQLTAFIVILLMVLGGLALLSLLLWSLAWRWPYPHLWPQGWSLRNWANPRDTWGAALYNTALIGIATTTIALCLAIAWLEAEGRRPRAIWAEALIYLPLLLPQIAFLYGLNILFLQIGIVGGYLSVIWAQALFVFPYVMIALSDPWRALDPRLINSAAALGAGPWRRLFSVKLPILLRPILTAAAIGFAVSVAQYLPTLFLAAGRIATLTTEAVTLASGADRRVVGTYAALQALLPFMAYGAALFLPAVLYRNRRGLTP